MVLPKIMSRSASVWRRLRPDAHMVRRWDSGLGTQTVWLIAHGCWTARHRCLI